MAGLHSSLGVHSGEWCSPGDLGDGDGRGLEAGVPLRGVDGCDATFARSDVAFVGLLHPLSRLEAEEVWLLIQGGETVDGVRGGLRLPDFCMEGVGGGREM